MRSWDISVSHGKPSLAILFSDEPREETEKCVRELAAAIDRVFSLFHAWEPLIRT
jgi:hypothetical protein